MNKYTYSKNGSIIFECYDTLVTQADKQYFAYTGKDVSKQFDVGCSIQFNVTVIPLTQYVN